MCSGGQWPGDGTLLLVSREGTPDLKGHFLSPVLCASSTWVASPQGQAAGISQIENHPSRGAWESCPLFQNEVLLI